MPSADGGSAVGEGGGGKAPTAEEEKEEEERERVGLRGDGGGLMDMPRIIEDRSCAWKRRPLGLLLRGLCGGRPPPPPPPPPPPIVSDKGLRAREAEATVGRATPNLPVAVAPCPPTFLFSLSRRMVMRLLRRL